MKNVDKIICKHIEIFGYVKKQSKILGVIYLWLKQKNMVLATARFQVQVMHELMKSTQTKQIILYESVFKNKEIINFINWSM